jgi:tRNA pseudouridine55 synthase
MNGIIIVNKPTSFTSRDVVNKLNKILNTKKIGHTGTLDPIASGVLVVCIGTYTKLVDELTSLDKEYIATIKLGLETDTLDTEGTILKEEMPKPLDESKIIEVLNSFKGKSIQQVPAYSAVKIKGKKLYEYARNNEDIELPKREIEVFDIGLIKYQDNEIIFKVHVSKGTYIRSLIKDICSKLDILGTMSSLQRTKQGKFSIDDSSTLEDIESNNYKLLTVKDIFDYPIIELKEEEYQKVINGNKISLDCIQSKIILTYNNEEIAIYKKEDNYYKCYIMLKHQ